MKSSTDLRELLERIDRRSYPAYKDTRGAYRFDSYTLCIDNVQGDPFAAPSKVSVHIEGNRAKFPAGLYDTRPKRIALQDELLRGFHRSVEEFSFRAKGSGKSGLMAVSRPGQEILDRSACQIEEESGAIILRMEVGFPANGRTINARELIRIFFDFLPGCVKKTLFYQALEKEKLKKVAELAEDQQYIREQLKELGLSAFVANGACLPRESGVSKRPMKGAIRFCSPKSMEVTLNLPNHGPLAGMGIKKGVTLIVGGGYHGKSTLLKAIELGVYSHIAGDGREYVITDDTAMKIRAEDGRSISAVDISMFINHLPNGKDTVSFSTEDASGSTSQAANVVEGMEAGARVFLIDEDTSATNFMVRDELMQRVVHRKSEPITPFVERIRQLYEEFGISTILVAGSSGSYFHEADCILQMENYEPKDITEFAKEEAGKFPPAKEEAPECKMPQFARRPAGIRSKDKRDDRVKIKTTGCDTISLNKENIDMRYVEQLADTEQMMTLGYLLNYGKNHYFGGKYTLRDVVDKLCEVMEKEGLAKICEGSYLPAGLAMVRKQEIYACINRCRGMQFR